MKDSLPIIYIRSERRTLAISVGKDGAVRVRMPLYYPMEKAVRFVEEHAEWIEKAQKRVQAFREKTEVSPEREAELRLLAKKVLPEKVKHYAERMGLFPTSVRITSARGRYGSCSAKNGICFSFRVMLLPDAAIDYVVVHELAHIAEHNHSKRFYRVIEKTLPDYKERIRLLKGLS